MSTPVPLVWPSERGSFGSPRTMIRSADTASTTPPRLATTTAPESLAATYSMPVPTTGAVGRSKGTDCRCMLAPIRARLASSCSRKGISEVEIPTSCLGETSMYSMASGVTITEFMEARAATRSATNRLRPSNSALAWATVCNSSSSPVRYSISSVTRPSRTFRYGVSMNPKSLTRA